MLNTTPMTKPAAIPVRSEARPLLMGSGSTVVPLREDEDGVGHAPGVELAVDVGEGVPDRLLLDLVVAGCLPHPDPRGGEQDLDLVGCQGVAHLINAQVAAVTATTPVTITAISQKTRCPQWSSVILRGEGGAEGGCGIIHAFIGNVMDKMRGVVCAEERRNPLPQPLGGCGGEQGTIFGAN